MMLIVAAPAQAQRHTRDVGLIQFLSDLQSGQIDSNKVTPRLYNGLTKQRAKIAATLGKFGAILQVHYVATDTARKDDIYVVQFQNRWAVWRFALTPDGKVATIRYKAF